MQMEVQKQLHEQLEVLFMLILEIRHSELLYVLVPFQLCHVAINFRIFF
jgi:hypothetical protein